MNTKKNYILIAILVIFHMIASMVWYGFFTESWLQLSGLTEEAAKSVSPMAYFLAAVAAGLAGYSLLWIFEKTKVKTGKHGFIIAGAIGFSLFFLELVTQDMYQIKPLALSLMNGGNYYMFLLVSGFVLGKYRDK